MGDQPDPQTPWEFLIAQEERHDTLSAEQFPGENNAPAQARRSWVPRAVSEPNAADWIVALFTVVIAFVGILQWKVIGGQLDEMKKGSADTHELAVQAKNQADRNSLRQPPPMTWHCKRNDPRMQLPGPTKLLSRPCGRANARGLGRTLKRRSQLAL